MPSKLDLRSPTIVVVGRWNDAILNEPGWIARHVLERPEGEEIEVRAFMRQDNGMPAQPIWSFPTFAISCTGPRLELYQISAEDLSIYGVLRTISQLLPHTPVSGFGINFKISSDEDMSGVSEKLETKEVFDSIGILKVFERSDTIDIAKDAQVNIAEDRLKQCRLKLARATDFSNLTLDFNFHQDITTISDITTLLDANPVGHWGSVRNKVLSDVYAIEQLEEIPF